MEGLGFKWNVRESRTPWNVRLEELRVYKARYGNCNVPNNWSENVALSHWVAKQRQSLRPGGNSNVRRAKGGKAGKKKGGGKGDTLTPLEQERVDQLNELGFDWRHAAVPKNAIDGSLSMR